MSIERDFGRIKAGYVKPKPNIPAFVSLVYNEVVLYPNIHRNMAYAIRTNLIKSGYIKKYFKIIPV